jgi:hypothetical protein
MNHTHSATAFAESGRHTDLRIPESCNALRDHQGSGNSELLNRSFRPQLERRSLIVSGRFKRGHL